VLSGVGLLLLSYANTLPMALAAGTVFAVGVSYFWPTMIGVTSERVPKGGALALAMMGAVGMVTVGLVTTPMMGRIADVAVHPQLEAKAKDTTACLQSIVTTYPDLAAQAKGRSGADIEHAAEAAKKILDRVKADGSLPLLDTANALRLAKGAAPDSPAGKKAAELLGPAENYGGQVAFRWVASLSLFLTLVFGILFAGDLARGGYRAESLGSASGS
jgi:hypothetical protein